MNFPGTRFRRLRQTPRLRDLVSETGLSKNDLVQPLFVKEGLDRPAAIDSMPGQFQHSVKSLVEEAKQIEGLGLPAIILFGIPRKKDALGKPAFASNGIIQKAVGSIKKNCRDLLVITDICLCEYLTHGHCGHIKNGQVVNDASVATLAKIALSHARAGADILAPSDMMDGRVGAIRRTLDSHDFTSMPILSYAVKYSSAFYAPFREAAHSAPAFGDRRSYQMDPANRLEALRESASDVREGADMILVKPALSYLDIIREVRDSVQCPVGAYSVSGEYSMIKAAAAKGWLDEKRTVLETHLAIKRAGASFILTYWAKSLAQWLRDE